MRGRNPLAVIGFILSLLGGPLGLIISILALRRANETGEGRRLSIAGIAISVAGFAIGIVVVLSVMTGQDNPPIDESQQPRPDGTTVTVNPAVDATTAAPTTAAPATGHEITAAQIRALATDPASLRGRTFVVHGTVDGDDPEVTAVLDPGGRRVVLSGQLVGDYEDGDDFTATVTVTTNKNEGLPVLTVSDIDLA